MTKSPLRPKPKGAIDHSETAAVRRQSGRRSQRGAGIRRRGPITAAHQRIRIISGRLKRIPVRARLAITAIRPVPTIRAILAVLTSRTLRTSRTLPALRTLLPLLPRRAGAPRLPVRTRPARRSRRPRLPRLAVRTVITGPARLPRRPRRAVRTPRARRP